MSQAKISLQQKLIKTSLWSSILAGAIALCLLFALSAYQTMDTQDAIMDEIADFLVAQTQPTQSSQTIGELSKEFDISYVVQHQQRILAQSKLEDQHDVSAFVSERIADDYGFYWQDRQLWRSYKRIDSESKREVLMLQPMQERVELLLQSVLGYAAVLLLLWGLQWVLLKVLMKRDFAVIRQFSEQISLKNPKELSPIDASQPAIIELEPIRLQLNSLMQRLGRALEAEHRFTADASHELRSPLSAIQMRLQVLRRKYQDHPQLATEMLAIQQDVSRGTQVLENLLLLARLDPSKEEDLPKTQVDVQAITERLLSDYQESLQQHHLILHSNLEPVTIEANAELLQICLRNLIDNAVNYTPDQGTIQIRLQQQGRQLYWQIDNSGEGLDETVIQHFGERFYRVLGSQVQGSGLGLSICKKIVELHQGQIKFSASELGGLKVLLSI
ncbi:HAMP domain-containing histidine kinase [Acinetobacter sp. SwsAc6]|uniref:sensor histidine kinase n=1 Tax=Acinetobacter TaxID=469 RepID=UPI000D115C94|nr:MULTISPECIES: HAMP domain-containing sensor histidine kinase [Acinetobacter]NWK75878.1 HAMP domain-containing histidine kinase [Acinetobacter sp. SwsAc6]QCO22583.1 GHKL domain-containing protein [Acinetobacter cumulans]